jgi:eukaryotic translation initiation factor 2-alpha kinase 4
MLWSFVDEDIEVLLSRLEKTNPSLVDRMRPAVDEMKATVQHAVYAGVSKPIIYRPLMLGAHLSHYKDGVLVEVVRKTKRLDVLAAAGRYVYTIQVTVQTLMSY